MIRSHRHLGSRSRVRRLPLCALAIGPALAVILLAGRVAPARALITPPTIVAGPSPSILGVGNVSIAPDGTGGVVWRQLSGGAPHIFASRFIDGRWSAPIQVDSGQPGPATFPAIAAGDGGRLLVVWVQPWASESTGGNPPQTIYQLVSSVIEPGSSGFGPAVQVDPNDVGDGTGVYPALAMAPDGDAYVVYRVVTFNYSSSAVPPPGTPPQLHPGDQLVDVRVASFNGLSWNSLGIVNALPDQVTLRKPTATNAPVIAIDPGGGGLVLWQEPTIDGVARIWARRLFGSTVGNALEVSPQTLNGAPVTVDADAPAVSLSDFAAAKVAFRLAGGAGSPLGSPHIFINTLLSQFAPGANSFSGPVPVAGATTVGPPSVAVDDTGAFQAGFSADGQTRLVTGNQQSANPPHAVGAAGGDPALATLDPDGGGAAVWPSFDQAGRAVVDVRQLFPDGGYQTAALSAPISGPINALSIGPSGQGDALIAFQQGLSSTSQVVVAEVQAPPHKFYVFTPIGWVGPGHERLTWEAARSMIGSVTYSVVVDGQVRARGIHRLGYRFPRQELGAGRHPIKVIATDRAGEETVSPVATMKVDPYPPRVRVRRLGRRRVRVSVYDDAAGVRARATVISFGDGTASIRGRTSAVHAYAAPGLYLLTVRCTTKVGVHAVHHIWVGL
jgi:hypothetical protein